MRSWSAAKLSRWIKKWGKKLRHQGKFQKYSDVILEEEIDGEMFLVLSCRELTSLGFNRKHAEMLLKQARGYL